MPGKFEKKKKRFNPIPLILILVLVALGATVFALRDRIFGGQTQ